jgi:probable HAF family extracellular repeat protein
MKTLSIFRVTFTTLLMIVALSSMCFAQQYTVTDLGTLGGQSSGALALNNSGQVVGYAYGTNGNAHAFLWSQATGMLDLGLLHPQDTSSYGNAVNNSGEVAGSSGEFAFLWTPKGRMVDLGSLGGTPTIAYGINNSDQVVGDGVTTDGQTHAFLWTSASGMQDLGTLGGNFSVALAVNDAGEVVGESHLSDNVTFHAFIWTQATGMQDLGGSLGSNTAADAISPSGEIVGTSTQFSGLCSQIRLGVIWDLTRVLHQLGAPNCNGTTATGINDSTQVTGYFFDINHNIRGFLWTPSAKLQDLSSLISPKEPYISWANGINRVGQIAAIGSNNHALLLTPTKQPSSQRSKP